MSTYVPDPTKCSVGYAPGGWYIYDRHGLLDGPYASKSEAIRVISGWEREDYEAKQQELSE